jgi:hypothetical protein
VTVERPRAPSRARRGAGSVAAADSLRGRSRVQWLDAGGRVTRSLWLPAWTVTGGEVQVSVAVDDSDRVAVAGERSGELFLIGAEGGVLGRLAGLASPRALGFAPDGSLLVAEAGAGRVRRFTPSSIARE